MKKYLSYIVSGLVLITIVGLIIYEQNNKALGAGGNFNDVKQYLTVNADPYMNHTTATSTQTNLVYIGTATTSYAFSTEGSDQVNFNLYLAMATTTRIGQFEVWSSTSTTSDSILPLIYCYDFSNSTTTTTDLMWFPTASNCSSFTSSTNGTSTLAVAVTNVNSKYMRINFQSPTATSTRVGLWAQAILKKGF